VPRETISPELRAENLRRTTSNDDLLSAAEAAGYPGERAAVNAINKYLGFKGERTAIQNLSQLSEDEARSALEMFARRRSEKGLLDERGSAPAELFNWSEITRVGSQKLRNFLHPGTVKETTPPPLTPTQAKRVQAYLDDTMKPRMLQHKIGANQHGVNERNRILYDYAGGRRGFDEVMTYAMPYWFWWSRSGKQWPIRLLTHPNVLSNYARYKQAVRDTNREHYRKLIGDPNAELPLGWDYGIQIPLTDLSIDFERKLFRWPTSSTTTSRLPSRRRRAGRPCSSCRASAPPLYAYHLGLRRLSQLHRPARGRRPVRWLYLAHVQGYEVRHRHGA